MKKTPRLIGFMNAYSQGKSGGDMVFIEVAKRLKNHNKSIVTSLAGKKLCEESGLRGRFYLTTHELEFRHIILTYIIRTLKALFVRFSIEEGDILLGSSDFLPDTFPIFWFKLTHPKTKWIQHIFHLIPSSRRIPFLAQRISFLLIKLLSDKIIVDNSLLRKELISFGFNPTQIFVNHPGINFSLLRSIKISNNKNFDGIFMGQLRRSKGIFDLVKIWRLICQKMPSRKLGIIGRGSPEVTDQLRGEIKRYGLENNIDILGYLPNDDAFATIKGSKIFIFPSFEEGFGIAPLEAQALGLPVIAWDLPVFEEIFPKGMVKIKKGDIKIFSDETLKLLENRSYHQRLSKEAVNNARHYDWEKVAKREHNIIETR